MNEVSRQHTERVSCKLAMYSMDGTKVLLVEYHPDDYGLPGGHIEQGESPMGACRREIKEELGIDIENISLKDSWRHPNGKVLLGYTTIIDESIDICISPTELRSAQWTPLIDISSGKISAGTYDQFILQFAPN